MGLLYAADAAVYGFADHARAVSAGGGQSRSYLLALALAVSVFEGEFAGAVFGAVCGLMWDYTAAEPWGCWHWS